MPIAPQELVRGIAKLASLPEVCVRVNEMVDDPRCSAADVGKVISRDTALTAQLLRISNSSFFNFPSKISTISRAITVIGERELRYLVLALSAVRTFNQIPIELANMASFWRHSVYCGVVSRLIATKCHVLHSERLFVAGMLHDIGMLVILNRVPELERVVLYRSNTGREPVYLAEREVLGCDHADVGAELLRHWNLPAVLIETVACHHDIEKAVDAKLDAAIVHIANVISNRAELPTDYDAIPEFNPKAWELTGLDESILPEIAEEAGVKFAESWALIQPLVRKAR